MVHVVSLKWGLLCVYCISKFILLHSEYAIYCRAAPGYFHRGQDGAFTLIVNLVVVWTSEKLGWVGDTPSKTHQFWPTYKLHSGHFGFVFCLFVCPSFFLSFFLLSFSFFASDRGQPRGAAPDLLALVKFILIYFIFFPFYYTLEAGPQGYTQQW